MRILTLLGLCSILAVSCRGAVEYRSPEIKPLFRVYGVLRYHSDGYFDLTVNSEKFQTYKVLLNAVRLVQARDYCSPRTGPERVNCADEAPHGILWPLNTIHTCNLYPHHRTDFYTVRCTFKPPPGLALLFFGSDDEVYSTSRWVVESGAATIVRQGPRPSGAYVYADGTMKTVGNPEKTYKDWIAVETTAKANQVGVWRTRYEPVETDMIPDPIPLRLEFQ